ncbi:hypothetical protein BJV82DRAFT_300517 [Fennellomyces sp. T-0311]|nr:hypothetical protein BJV82DRAFT_300517 [Fennellomyces sp. T-0311]
MKQKKDDSRYRNGVCNKNLAKPQQLFVQNSLAFNTVDSRSRSSDVWTSLPDITSPTLQKLSFSFDGNSKSKQWIGSCPELEEIILKNMENMDGSIFYAIKRLPKLRRLEIQSCKNYNRSRFESFFHMLAYKRDLVKLHTVILNDFNTVLPESLHAISRYRNLRSLRLIKCKIISADAIGMFATNLKEMDSLLEELMLTQIGAVTDGILVQVVVHIPRLQRLLLEHLSHITDDGIVQIVDRSAHTSLSLLGIHECSQVTEHGVGYAARRLSVKTNSSV